MRRDQTPGCGAGGVNFRGPAPGGAGRAFFRFLAGRNGQSSGARGWRNHRGKKKKKTPKGAWGSGRGAFFFFWGGARGGGRGSPTLGGRDRGPKAQNGHRKIFPRVWRGSRSCLGGAWFLGTEFMGGSAAKWAPLAGTPVFGGRIRKKPKKPFGRGCSFGAFRLFGRKEGGGAFMGAPEETVRPRPTKRNRPPMRRAG